MTINTTPPRHTPHQLRKLLEYNPTFGSLLWRERTADMFDGSDPAGRAERWNERHAHKEVVRSPKHKTISIQGTKYTYTRVVWAVAFGAWPTRQVNKNNGDPLDHRVGNMTTAGAAVPEVTRDV